MQTGTTVDNPTSRSPGRRRRAWIVVAGLAGATLVAALRYAPDPKLTLVRATAGADRLEVVPTFPNDAPAILVMQGHVAIDELIDLIELNGWFAEPPCKCLGEIEFRFYRGGSMVAAVGLAHGERLKWRGGPWRGDRMLTDDSCRALRSWLMAKGYALPEPSRGHGH